MDINSGSGTTQYRFFFKPISKLSCSKVEQNENLFTISKQLCSEVDKTRYFYFLKSCECVSLAHCQSYVTFLTVYLVLLSFCFFFVWGFSAFSQICGKSNYIPTLSKVNTAAEKLGSQNIVRLKYWGLDQFLSQKTTCIFNPIYFSRVDPPADELVQRHR